MIPQPRPLLAVLAGMPDVRSRRGIRHPLSALLAQAWCAMLCEARRKSAIAAWGRHDGAHIARALGFRHPPPCAATLHAQQAVAEKTNEITAVETVLSQLVLTGCVVTMNALLPQTAVAQTIVAAGGDDVMVVKAHQPQLRADMALIFAEPPVGDPQETADPSREGMGVLSGGASRPVRPSQGIVRG